MGDNKKKLKKKESGVTTKKTTKPPTPRPQGRYPPELLCENYVDLYTGLDKQNI